jgi:hypothetical protein
VKVGVSSADLPDVVFAHEDGIVRISEALAVSLGEGSRIGEESWL